MSIGTPEEFDLNHVRLATGVRVPRPQAAIHLFELHQLLAGPNADPGLATRFRDACLSDAPLDPAAAAEMAPRGLTTEDGTAVDPTAREMVRAALRGEGGGLYVVSPYLTPVDRAISDLFVSREQLASSLPKDLADTLLRKGILACTPLPPEAETPTGGVDSVKAIDPNRRWRMPPPSPN